MSCYWPDEDAYLERIAFLEKQDEHEFDDITDEERREIRDSTVQERLGEDA